MSFLPGKSDKKDLTFELNLMPVFDVLSVCICFLLMTVVWVQVGAIKTSQAVGGQSQAETKSPPTVWVTIDEKSNVTFMVKNSKQNLKSVIFSNSNKQLSYELVKKRIAELSQAKQKIEIALLIPSANTSYDTIIQFMDAFRSVGINDIGVSPL